MIFLKYFIIIFLLFTTNGCIYNFHKQNNDSLKIYYHNKYIEDFSFCLAKNIEFMNSVIFKYRNRIMSGMGYGKIDYNNKSFDIVCFTNLGFKLFQISKKEDQITSDFFIKEFSINKGFYKIINNDMESIFLDWTFLEDYKFYQNRNYAVFVDKNIKYIFDKKNRYLIQKIYYKNNKKIYSIFYFDYIKENSKIYPKNIKLINYKYKYQFLLKIKDIKIL